MKSSICSLVLICIFSSCQFQEKQTFDILITHAAIVDVKSGKTIAEQLIGISDDTIRLVADINQEANYTGKTIIDAKGKYVLPGLWDNHVHFRGGDSLISENRDMLPLFLKYGVTAVRDAGGDITPSVLQWQKEIAEGKLAGPSIFTSGPKLDGDQPAWPGSIMVTDSADVKAALDSLEVLGVDYVKMYDGNLTKEMFYSIIKAAEERGLKTTGHMPLSANILEAAELGLDGSEHLYYVLKACSPKEDSLTQLNMGYGMMSEILQTYDTDLAKQVFNQLAKEKVYITPTLYIGKVLANILETDHQNDSLLSLIGKGIQHTYQGRIEGAKRAKSSGSTMRQEMEKKSTEIIVPMVEAGIQLLVGSDCGPYNSYVYPGAALHGELRELVTAGLRPQQALQASILNGPAFFGLEDYYGTVDEGKVADLIISEKNPLEDIEFSDAIWMVIHKGKTYASHK